MFDKDLGDEVMIVVEEEGMRIGDDIRSFRVYSLDKLGFCWSEGLGWKGMVLCRLPIQCSRD
jgi:hypothetical protein